MDPYENLNNSLSIPVFSSQLFLASYIPHLMKTICVVYKIPVVWHWWKHLQESVSSLCSPLVKVTLVFTKNPWPEDMLESAPWCPARQWAITKKVGLLFSLCWRRQWESKTALYLSGSRSVLCSPNLSTPPLNTRWHLTQPLTTLGWSASAVLVQLRDSSLSQRHGKKAGGRAGAQGYVERN